MRAEKANRLPRVDPDKELIDRMIDWRRVNRPADESPIKTTLNPEALHKALGLPDPLYGAKYPDSVSYRGYLVHAKATPA